MSESTVAKKTTAKAEKAEESAAEKAAKARDRKIAAGECVVDSNIHVGRAVNGLVCSYHAMHYDAYGNRRV